MRSDRVEERAGGVVLEGTAEVDGAAEQVLEIEDGEKESKRGGGQGRGVV